MSETVWISGGSLLIAALSLAFAFANRKKDSSKATKTDIEAAATEKAENKAQLGLAVSGIMRMEKSFDMFSKTLGEHDKEIVCTRIEVRNLAEKLEQHINTHPPNTPAFKRTRTTNSEGE